MERSTRQSKIPSPWRNWTVILAIAATLLAVLSEYFGGKEFTDWIIRGVAILGLGVAAYFVYLRAK